MYTAASTVSVWFKCYLYCLQSAKHDYRSRRHNVAWEKRWDWWSGEWGRVSIETRMFRPVVYLFSKHLHAKVKKCLHWRIVLLMRKHKRRRKCRCIWTCHRQMPLSDKASYFCFQASSTLSYCYFYQHGTLVHTAWQGRYFCFSEEYQFLS